MLRRFASLPSPCPRSLYRPILSNLRRSFTSDIKVDELQLTLPFLEANFPHRWLRDSCQCPSCVHPSTLQKLHRSSDIPADIRPASGGLVLRSEGVHVRWSDGHESFYTFSFLERHSSPSNLATFHKVVEKTPWDASSISKVSDLYIAYDDLSKPSRFLSAINQLSHVGLLFITSVPTDKTDDEICEVRKLADTFGVLLPTFYGETWDVRNVRNSRNIAYTNLDLGLHMDLLYFQHPPRYQILHCLRNRVAGGKSIFVDGFHAASVLQETYPADFDILATTPVPFHYINDSHHLHYEHQTIELEVPSPADASKSSQQPIKHINYSPPFQAPLLLNSTPPSFYTALGRFAALLDKPANRVEYLLREGDAVVFDNRRVLHARMAFTDTAGSDTARVGETNRWLKGCYFEADSMLDRGRVLSEKLQKTM
ncbi:hypothetical protein F5I97DRAFT_1930637 [Phlebopus sp. FC_14]|nr:hypothetical protein F5I97DRAFT_1930637 [Phlebopus sp. FC_14]